MPMRPKKPRFLDGVQLEDNLYPDPRKRSGYFLYVRPDGSKTIFDAGSVEDANRQAREANEIRDTFPANRPIPTRDQLQFHVPRYTTYRENINSSLKEKQSWKNRKYALKQFAGEFPALRDLEFSRINFWWDTLTHSQQKLRMAEFRRFCNWLMGQGLAPKLAFNPFTTADDVPRLMLREKASKKRPDLLLDQYWKIYNKAPELGYDALQIAMEISLYTMARESDVVKLQFDKHVIGDEFKIVVAKSEAQKGTARATRLTWNLNKHPILRQTVNRARELSLKNKRCPYLVSHTPLKRVWNQDKDHICQVMPDRLSRMFAEVRDKCEIPGVVFHGVRGLSMTLYRKQGHTLEEIRQIAGQESIVTTSGYIDATDLPHEQVELRMKR